MNGKTNCAKGNGGPLEFVNIRLITNQSEHSDLIGSKILIRQDTRNKEHEWKGNEITFTIPAYIEHTIEFPEVEGYKKPDNITFVAVEGNSRTIEAEYKAELVKINVTSSNGSAVSGATLTINGKQQTWNGTEIRQLVPFGTQYSVVAGAVSGFGTPSAQTFTAQNPEREVSVVYIASSLKVNILSNQGTDAAIASVKATVKYGSTSVEVANGGMVNLPTNTSVTISFPEVADYKKPADITYTHTGGLVEKSGTYQCELLTVNVSADSGSVSGFEITISKRETVGVATKYTKLEYIESNGTQYIDTGVSISPSNGRKLKYVIDSQMTGSLSSANINGSGWGASPYFNSFYVGFFQGIMYYGNGRTDESVSGTAADNNRHIFTYDAKNGVASISGIKEVSFTYQEPDGALPLLLFGYSQHNNTPLHSERMYSCKIYEDNVLVRDYIPALRSDGIAGMYDAINDTFTASSGSSNFIAGGESSEIIATQTSVTGAYKIPFDTSYVVQASRISGYDTPQPITRVASAKSYTIAQQYAVITVRDLSLYDVYGNRINRSTANCYVVRETGQYKFPFVYGNAIKNGKVNTAAFTNNGGANSHDFVNSKNVKITQPYVDKDYNLIDDNITMKSDTENVISNIFLTQEEECYFVCFTVNSIPAQGANAVLDVRLLSTVCWSWHIWLWPHDLSPVEITNSTGVKYNIMPVNLASKYDSDGIHIKNWFYQWGRMNPMLLPNSWNSATDHEYFGQINFTTYPKADSLANGLLGSNMFYYNSASPYNWFGTKSYYNLWDAACTGTGNSDNDTVKTVYDPCPVGWKIPNGNTFTGLSILSSDNGVVKMRRYSGDAVGVGFPLSGNRHSNDGSLVGIGTSGYVWTSAAASENFAYNLSYDSNSITPQLDMGASRRAYGKSIRPVQDDNIQLDVIVINFKIGTTASSATPYQAESGMTWFEWVNSEYNTGNYIISNERVVKGSNTVCSNNSPVSLSENIFGIENGDILPAYQEIRIRT